MRPFSRSRSLAIATLWWYLIGCVPASAGHLGHLPAGGEPCADLLDLADRPTSDTACTTSPHRSLLEAGYRRTSVTGAGARSLVEKPEALLRFGLSPSLEARALLPSDTNGRFDGEGMGLKLRVGDPERTFGSLGYSYALPDANAIFTDFSTTSINSLGTGAASTYDVGYQRLLSRRVLFDIEA